MVDCLSSRLRPLFAALSFSAGRKCVPRDETGCCLAERGWRGVERGWGLEGDGERIYRLYGLQLGGQRRCQKELMMCERVLCLGENMHSCGRVQCFGCLRRGRRHSPELRPHAAACVSQVSPTSRLRCLPISRLSERPERKVQASVSWCGKRCHVQHQGLVERHTCFVTGTRRGRQVQSDFRWRAEENLR